MGNEAQKLFEQALALPPEERLALADALTDSVDSSDATLSPEWIA